MSSRRGNTKEQIQRIALDLFAERGYENTSLQEVSDRLQITRPALYYHFKTKEAILAGVVEDLTDSMDELLDWARQQPPTAEARHTILHRVAQLINDQYRPLLRFAQVNQTVMRDHPVGEQLLEKLSAMVSVLVDPATDEIRQLESRLAVVTLAVGSFPELFNIGAAAGGELATTMRLAEKLADGLDWS